MHDERVKVGAKLGHDELDPLAHQPGDEVNVAAQAVQLGYGNRAFATLGFGERGDELGTAGEGVRTVAVSISINSRAMSKPSDETKRARASRCASRPRARDRTLWRRERTGG